MVDCNIVVRLTGKELYWLYLALLREEDEEESPHVGRTREGERNAMLVVIPNGNACEDRKGGSSRDNIN